MNSVVSNLVFLFAMIFFLSCSDNDNSSDDVAMDLLDTSQSYELKDISYGDSAEQILDIYLPENRTMATKIIILIHGGGWTSGDKRDMNGFKDLFRAELPDVAIVNINYRLADLDNKPYPMQLNDISKVVDFLKLNNEKYTIGEELGLVGISSGGHLALLWSYAFDAEQKTNMVCSIIGPTDLTDPNYTNNDNEIIVGLLSVFGTNPSIEFLEQVSPYHQVTATSPPTILFYGGQDPLVPVSQGISMRDRLDLLGVENNYTLYENSGHGWTGMELFDTSVKLKAFIEANL